MATWLGRFAAVCFLVSLPAPIAAQSTQRVSVGWSDQEGHGHAVSPAVSAEGRFVAFQSDAPDLVPGDTNASADVFLRDRQLGTTRRVSLAWDGSQADSSCITPAISADGRFVAFASAASNLVPGDAYAYLDVFVRDRLGAATELASLTPGAVPGHGNSYGPKLSADGRFVVFQSDAPDLIPGAVDGHTDVFVRDRLTGTTERVSVGVGGAQPDGSSGSANISPDGRFVVFQSAATNLVAGDVNDEIDVFVRDRQTGATELVGLGSGLVGGGTTPSISADGRFVAFTSAANHIVPGDTNNHSDVFVRDRLLGTIDLVSRSTGGGGSNFACYGAAISDDGRFVAFWSLSWSLVAGDTNQQDDVFLRDRLLGMLVRASLDAGGAQSNGYSLMPAISGDGRWISFHSAASNLVAGDANGTMDVFVRDRDATGFASLCDPGDLVVDCPCANPPSGPTRGCDNSAGTGGAVLAASGTTSLSADTLVFVTSGEKPTALSIVLQGRTFSTSGGWFGQGITCVGPVLKRLYAKNAVGGSIMAPDFATGDLPVSAQSAAKGDVIQAGQPRWYIVYYRDNTVLGGCPPTSNFNATQTGQVNWSL